MEDRDPEFLGDSRATRGGYRVGSAPSGADGEGKGKNKDKRSYKSTTGDARTLQELAQPAPPAAVDRKNALFALHDELEASSYAVLDRQCVRSRNDSQPKVCNARQLIITML